SHSGFHVCCDRSDREENAAVRRTMSRCLRGRPQGQRFMEPAALRYLQEEVRNAALFRGEVPRGLRGRVDGERSDAGGYLHQKVRTLRLAERLLPAQPYSCPLWLSSAYCLDQCVAIPIKRHPDGSLRRTPEAPVPPAS